MWKFLRSIDVHTLCLSLYVHAMLSFGKLCVYLISAPICFFNHGVHTSEYFDNNKALKDIQSMKANNDQIILGNI